MSNYQINNDNYVIAFINNVTLRRKAEAKIEKLYNELEVIVEQRTKDLKKALLDFKKAQVELDKATSFQKAIIDNAGAMIVATDTKGLITVFNPEASLNIGYSQSEVIGKMTPILFHDKNEINRRRADLFSEFGIKLKNDFDVMVEKAKRNIHEEEVYTYTRKDGSTFPVALTISAVKDKNGTITGFMGVSIDITERKKAEEKLTRSLEKERDLGELKTRFVSMASHEFRTPLSTILSSAYLIEKYSDTKDQPDREKHLHRITSSVSMLTDILNDFLSLGKIEEGKIQVRLTCFNIEQVINNIVDEISGTFKKKQIVIYSHTGLTDVFLDQTLLKNMIYNLVSNASKFSPEKSLIEIKTTYRKQQLVLSVKDRGIGISKEDQKHLMERFFRGVNAGNIQGTGLGLHLVSKYAELMNGTVDCISELEKGTEFVITFNLNKQKP
ncbi:MAG: PAS domain-containing sensor histidine kinase [Chitinophagaceae bacterium]|nr:PAS domain-containing sensor histidine kinase [Chitinophagaceae bacterium]